MQSYEFVPKMTRLILAKKKNVFTSYKISFACTSSLTISLPKKLIKLLNLREKSFCACFENFYELTLSSSGQLVFFFAMNETKINKRFYFSLVVVCGVTFRLQ